MISSTAYRLISRQTGEVEVVPAVAKQGYIPKSRGAPC